MVGTVYGMPSSHAQFVSFFTAFLILFLFIRYFCQFLIDFIYYNADKTRTLNCAAYKAVTRRGVLGVKTPPRNYLKFFLVSQLCLFVQQNISRLRLLNIGVCLN